MKIMKLNDRSSIGPQPNLSDFKVLKSLGFGSVFNNRPDGEEPSQPTADEAAFEAEAVGLRYARQPITLNAIAEGDIRRFQNNIAELEGPVFAHCNSGTRSLTLWILGEVPDGRMQASEILPFGEQHGIDLKVAAKWAADQPAASGGAK